jgi:hypothetical protein
MKLDLAESNFVLLRIAGATTHSSFLSRVPTQESLEEFLRTEIYPYCARVLSTGADDWRMRCTLPDNRTWQQWGIGGEAVALRRLWEVPRALAREDVTALTEEKIEGEAPKRLSLRVTRDLHQRARARGVTSDSAMGRPRPLALAEIGRNYLHGCIPRYIEWEDYTSEEEELRADRLGVKPRDQGFRMVASEGHFKSMVTEADFVRRIITGPLDMQEVLQVREHAHGLLELVEPALYGELHVIYFDVLRGRVPLRMRRVSMGEVMQFDRELHLDILETIQKREDSTMQDGIRWFLDHKVHSLWRLLDPRIESQQPKLSSFLIPNGTTLIETLFPRLSPPLVRGRLGGDNYINLIFNLTITADRAFQPCDGG